MTVTVPLDHFKKAIRLEGYESVAEWAREQRNPDGERIARTNVYQAAKIGSPKWLVDRMTATIRNSRQKHPDFWVDDN